MLEAAASGDVTISFSDLRVGAYCPRQLYYRRHELDRTPPSSVSTRRELAFRYPELIDCAHDKLADTAVVVSPETFQQRLREARSRLTAWPSLIAPAARDVFVDGECGHGIVRKVLTDPLRPVVISPGKPPQQGVWTSHTVQAVASARALTVERTPSHPVDTAFVEYPAYGVIRKLQLTPERILTYRRVRSKISDLETLPESRQSRSKCEACQYRHRCRTGLSERSSRVPQ